jgi:hypothetical protein
MEFILVAEIKIVISINDLEWDINYCCYANK